MKNSTTVLMSINLLARSSALVLLMRRYNLCFILHSLTVLTEDQAHVNGDTNVLTSGLHGIGLPSIIMQLVGIIFLLLPLIIIASLFSPLMAIFHFVHQLAQFLQLSFCGFLYPVSGHLLRCHQCTCCLSLGHLPYRYYTVVEAVLFPGNSGL